MAAFGPAGLLRARLRRPGLVLAWFCMGSAPLLEIGAARGCGAAVDEGFATTVAADDIAVVVQGFTAASVAARTGATPDTQAQG